MVFGNFGGWYSVKSQIWTRGRKDEFGNWGGDVLPNVRFGLGEENWSWEISGGGGNLSKVGFGLTEEKASL